MNPDRSQTFTEGLVSAKNNTQALGGYDAYFGTYTVDDKSGVVTQALLGSLSKENVGATLSRAMTVDGDTLVIRLETGAWNGTPVVRTLTWERVG
jgi:Lipocalin-like domain